MVSYIFYVSKGASGYLPEHTLEAKVAAFMMQGNVTN